MKMNNMSSCTLSKLRKLVATLPLGRLTQGNHANDDPNCCVLEAISLCRGYVDKTDNPAVLELPDIRGLNDADWPNGKSRTANMLRVVDAIYDWKDWPDQRKDLFVQLLLIRCSTHIVSGMRGLSKAVVERLKRVKTAKGAIGAVLDCSVGSAGVDRMIMACHNTGASAADDAISAVLYFCQSVVDNTRLGAPILAVDTVVACAKESKNAQ